MAAAVPVVMYSDEELRVIVKRPENADAFVFDFDRVWPELGYSRKDPAVRALVSFKEGIDWIIKKEATDGVCKPTSKYWLTEDCARVMGIHHQRDEVMLMEQFEW